MFELTYYFILDGFVWNSFSWYLIIYIFIHITPPVIKQNNKLI